MPIHDVLDILLPIIWFCLIVSQVILMICLMGMQLELGRYMISDRSLSVWDAIWYDK